MVYSDARKGALLVTNWWQSIFVFLGFYWVDSLITRRLFALLLLAARGRSRDPSVDDGWHDRDATH
jgi:hypothetical protein